VELIGNCGKTSTAQSKGNGIKASDIGKLEVKILMTTSAHNAAHPCDLDLHIAENEQQDLRRQIKESACLLQAAFLLAFPINLGRVSASIA
jgi:hypothetical protein